MSATAQPEITLKPNVELVTPESDPFPFDIRKVKNRYKGLKLLDGYDQLTQRIKAHKELRADAKIVCVLGGYDIIHLGHARFIWQCRIRGDVVVVFVDSDEALRRAKGENRPVVPENERLEMLCHLEWSDYVLLNRGFDERGLWDLQLPFRPDILVASERQPANFAYYNQLAEIAERVVVVPSQATTSTSNQLRKAVLKPAKELAQKITQAITENIVPIIEQTTENYLDKEMQV